MHLIYSDEIYLGVHRKRAESSLKGENFTNETSMFHSQELPTRIPPGKMCSEYRIS